MSKTNVVRKMQAAPIRGPSPHIGAIPKGRFATLARDSVLVLISRKRVEHSSL